MSNTLRLAVQLYYFVQTIVMLDGWLDVGWLKLQKFLFSFNRRPIQCCNNNLKVNLVEREFKEDDKPLIQYVVQLIKTYIVRITP